MDAGGRTGLPKDQLGNWDQLSPSVELLKPPKSNFFPLNNRKGKNVLSKHQMCQDLSSRHYPNDRCNITSSSSDISFVEKTHQLVSLSTSATVSCQLAIDDYPACTW